MTFIDRQRLAESQYVLTYRGKAGNWIQEHREALAETDAFIDWLKRTGEGELITVHWRGRRIR